jgi:sarcosine oxidase subunit gamma
VSAPEPADPFAGALRPGRFGIAAAQPVRIAARHCDLVQLTARKGQAEPLVAAVDAALHVRLPAPGRSAAAAALIALWMRPEGWMLMAPRGPEGALAHQARQACAGLGAVVDQTHARAVLSLSGPQAGAVLARLCRIDLHPRRFPAGSVAATPIAELSCLLFRRDDTPCFDVILPASYADWFLEALTHAAAGVGYEVPDVGSAAQLRTGSV